MGLNERSRLRARTDPNFAQLANTPQLQDLLAADSWTSPAGALHAKQIYAVAYDGNGKLLNAVLTSLQLLKEPFDPRVEVTPNWALIWAEFSDAH